MDWLKSILGDTNKREVNRLAPIVEAINRFEPVFEALSDDELRSKTAEFQARLATEALTADSKRTAYQPVLDALLPEAFAAVREAAKRTLGQRHYDVQLIGGIILHQGKIAEMRTGEGKTLVATLPLYVNALLGRGVHLITVNDYLAKRDGMWMGAVFAALGMSTGIVNQQGVSFKFTDVRRTTYDVREENAENPELVTRTSDVDSDWPNLESCSRLEAYQCDVTYGTNNEFGFDYLRDHMASLPEQLTVTKRGLTYAIVDEVDSILIDEARTPLIISAPAEESADLYRKFALLARQLVVGDDYAVDEKERTVALSEAGIKKMEASLGLTNIYDGSAVTLVYHLEEALRARALYQRDKEYVVKDGEVIIVDEFTGRLMPGRRYSEGLHQAIEAKEGVTVQRESDTLATITFQNLFRLYGKLAGMTGTALTEAEEFGKIYDLDVIEVPTHRPVVRVDAQDLIFKTEAAKIDVIVSVVRERSEAGQPVLLGTISIQKNEQLARALTAAGIQFSLLNAKQHEREATIIANAGRPGAVTVATNMAGRGVDIVLGGKPPEAVNSESGTVNRKDSAQWQEWEARHQQVLEAGGLAVIGTERHESRRIDNQLRGRSGRQGDPGYAQFFVSLEDDLMRIFGGDRLKGMMDRLGLPDDEPITHSLVSKSIEQAQRRVEGQNFDIRKHLVDYDDVMNRHREVLYRKRQRILMLDPATDGWLHDELVELMTDDERVAFATKVQSLPEPTVLNLERVVYLRAIDTHWIQHLNTMSELRRGIGLRGYAQRDPLVDYKEQAYGLFQALKNDIDAQTLEVLTKVEIQAPAAQPVVAQPMRRLRLQGADEALVGGISVAPGDRESPAASREPVAPAQSKDRLEKSEDKTVHGPPFATHSPSSSDVRITVRSPFERVQSTEQTITKPFAGTGRNDPCPCGSGTKYKKCHGRA
jgi:preprotein translocase subunit SecA